MKSIFKYFSHLQSYIFSFFLLLLTIGVSAQQDSLHILLNGQYEIQEIHDFLDRQKVDDKIELYNYAERVAKAKNDSLLLTHILFKQADYFFDQIGDYEPAIVLYKQVIQLAKSQEPSPILAKSYQSMALIWGQKGNLEKKIVFLDSAALIATQLKGEYSFQFSIPLNKASALLKLGREQEFINIYKENIHKLAQTKFADMEIMLIHNLAAYYANKYENTGEQVYLDTAYFHFEGGLKKADSLGIIRHIANFKMNFATTLALGPNPDDDKIDKYLEEAKQAFEELNDQYRQAIILHQMGIVALKRKNYSQSVSYFTQLLQISKEKTFTHLTHAALSRLHESYKHLGNYEQALHFFEKFSHLEDSINGFEAKEKILAIEKKYEIQQKANEVKALKKESEFNQIRYISFIAFMIMLSVFLLILTLTLRARSKTQTALETEKVLRLEAEVARKKLQEVHLQSSLDQKSKALLSKSIHLAEREEFTNKLLSFIDNTALSDGETLEKIKVWLNRDQKQEDLLAEFKIFFESHHSDFLAKVKDRYPKLTSNDERLLFFIKLGLSTKEIASILYLAPNSVKVARYRLKKKLFPENKEGSLEELLKTL